MLKPAAAFVVILAVFSIGFHEGSTRSKAASEAKIEEIGTKNFSLLKENIELQQQYLMSLSALHKLGIEGDSGKEILKKMILDEQRAMYDIKDSELLTHDGRPARR